MVMPIGIKTTDLPLKLEELQKIQPTRSDLPPGADSVRRLEGRGTGWFCELCDEYISPIFIRQGRWVYPACRECFHEELDEVSDGLVDSLKEDDNVAVLEGVIVAATETTSSSQSN